jgi:hypothetical protein
VGMGRGGKVVVAEVTVVAGRAVARATEEVSRVEATAEETAVEAAAAVMLAVGADLVERVALVEDGAADASEKLKFLSAARVHKKLPIKTTKTPTLLSC